MATGTATRTLAGPSYQILKMCEPYSSEMPDSGSDEPGRSGRPSDAVSWTTAVIAGGRAAGLSTAASNCAVVRAGRAGAVGGPLLLTAVLAAGGGWRVSYLTLAALAAAAWLGMALRRPPTAPPAQRAAGESGDGTGAEPGDERGWREVRLSFEHELAAAHRLAGFGGQVEVLSPPSVRERLLATAAEILDRYPS